MRFQLAQVDLYHLVKIIFRLLVHFSISCQLHLHLVGCIGHLCPAGSPQVLFHFAVIPEQGSRGTDLGAHVADGPFPGAGDFQRPRAEVFKDITGASLNGEDAGHFQDHILGR